MSPRWLSRIGVLALAIGLCTNVAAQNASGPDSETDTAAAQHTPPEASAPRLVLDTGVFSSEVRAITFTADGEHIAASSDSDIRIWEIRSGELIHTLRGFSAGSSGMITSIAADPQGLYLAVAVETISGSYLRVCAIDALDETIGYWGDPGIVEDEALAGISLGFRSAREITFSADSKYIGFVATTLAVGQGQQMVPSSSYLFFDWQKDELHHHFPVPEATGDGAPTDVFGARRLVQAGRFLGTDRYYVMPGIGSVLDVRTKSAVTSDASPELQWMQRVWTRIGNYYRGDSKINAYIDGDLPHRMLAVAYSTKREGKDIYQCDIWRGEESEPHASYRKLPWSPSELKVSHDGALVGVGDALGGVHVISAASGEPIFRTRSPIRSLYAASLDQSSGTLGMGKDHHRGAAWKHNDYADIARGFDLRKRRFVERPQGDFPRPVTDLDSPGIKARHRSNNRGSYVEVALANGETYSSAPIAKPSFTWHLSPGHDPGEVLLFRGGSGFFTADLVQSGDIVPKYGSRLRGFAVAVGSSEKSSVASDVNATADGKYVTVAWTDGSACIYRKSDFRPTALGELPFQGVPLDLKTIRVERVTNAQAAGGLQPGDQITAVAGTNVLQFMNNFFNDSLTNRPGAELEAEVLRNGVSRQLKFTLIPTTTNFVPSATSPVLTFIATKDDEWILFTPQGYYDASLGGHDLIGWKANRGPDEAANFFTARQLRKTLYRPDLIDSVINAVLSGQGDPTVGQATATETQVPHETVLDLRRPEQLESILPPEVTVAGLPENHETQQTTLTVSVTARSQNQIPVHSIVVLVNGRPPATRPVRPVRHEDGQMTLEQPIELAPGKNEIAVLATNAAATSTPRIFSLTRVGSETTALTMPKLYALSVGVADYQDDAYDLNYAAKDATAFASMLKEQEGKFYSLVSTTVLTDKDAGRTAVQDGMDWLLGSVTQHDLAVIFISGHGAFDTRRNFYFCTHEVDAERLRSTALAYTEIERLIEDLPCKVLLFADTCHSGAARGAKAINQDPWTDLVSNEIGAILFASSTPQEESIESEEWGHGLFTRAILDAMKEKKTDVNNDGYLSVNELDLSISERVKEMSKGRQHPTTQKPSTIRNFNLAVSGTE